MRLGRGRWWVVMAVCLQASTGLAANRSTGVVKAFLDESTSKYSEFVSSGKGQPDYEDMLYAWAKMGDNVDTLRRKTADTYGLPAPAAARLVDLTLQRGALDSDSPRPPTLVSAFEALARDFPQSELVLLEAARAVDDGSYNECNIDDLHRLLDGRADADAARLRIFDAVWCLPLLTERTSLRSGDTRSYLDMVSRSGELDNEWLTLAVLRIADSKATRDAGIDDATRADVRKQRVLAELANGYIADALAVLPSSPSAWPTLTGHFDSSDRREIAAAYVLQNDLAKARAWLLTASVEEQPVAKEDSYSKLKREARNNQLALLRRALDEPDRDDFAFLAGFFGSSSTVSGQTRVWQGLFDLVALAQGYPGLIANPYRLNLAVERQESLDKCYRCAPELTAMIERIASTYAPPPPPPASAAGPQLPDLVRERMARVLESPRPAWVEHALPLNLRSERDKAKNAATDEEDGGLLVSPAKGPQPGWVKRLPAGQLVRHEQHGRRLVAITASQSLDPTGEISSGGYWFSISDDGGETFAPPLYTGLRMYSPYVVLPDSKLPLFKDDRLQLEVAVRKLDDKNVMLPPVFLPFLEKRDDVFVEATLTDLARDSDGDGLTDLAEWAMMLAADVADTDGDGVNDAADPLPHIAATERRPGAAAMAAGLNRIFGNSLGAIITTDAADGKPGRTYALGVGTDAYIADSTRFIAGPPAFFAGLALNSRVIVLDPSQLERLSNARGKSFAMGIETFEISHDGNLAIMVWSSGWAGGTYLLKRRGDTWEIEVIGGWIT
jgi:hypothetical protein